MFLFLDGVHKLSFPKIWVALWGCICNEWGVKWFTSTSKVSAEKRIHNKNIFLVSNTLPPFTILSKNLWTIINHRTSKIRLWKLCSSTQIVWRQHANKKHFHKKVNLTELHLWYHLESDKHVVVTHTVTAYHLKYMSQVDYIVHNLLPQFGVIPTKSYTMLTSY